VKNGQFFFEKDDGEYYMRERTVLSKAISGIIFTIICVKGMI
jgi:hypothetical protein